MSLVERQVAERPVERNGAMEAAFPNGAPFYMILGMRDTSMVICGPISLLESLFYVVVEIDVENSIMVLVLERYLDTTYIRHTVST